MSKPREVVSSLEDKQAAHEAAVHERAKQKAAERKKAEAALKKSDPVPEE